MGFAAIIAKLKSKQQAQQTSAREQYIALLRKGDDISDGDAKKLEALASGLGIAIDQIEADAQAVAEVVRLERAVASASTAEQDLAAVLAAMASAEREFEVIRREWAPKFEALHAARKDAEARVTHLKCQRSNLDTRRQDRPDLFGEAQ